MAVLDLPFAVRVDDHFVRDNFDLVRICLTNQVRQHRANEGRHSTGCDTSVSAYR